jgi:hypothetical protein
MKEPGVARPRLVLAAAATGIAAALAAGYAAGGQAGLTGAAAVAAVGVLVVARGRLQGGTPRPVRPYHKERTPAVRTADFPAYRTVVSDLEWARLSGRHYQRALRPRLARLAAALGRPAPGAPTAARDADGPGPDLATLDRMIRRLEEP